MSDEAGHTYTFAGFPGPYWEHKKRRETMDSPQVTLRSGAEWQDIYKEVVIVYDPDGWDRKNFNESWAEEIPEDEWWRRVLVSTCLIKDLEAMGG